MGLRFGIPSFGVRVLGSRIRVRFRIQGSEFRVAVWGKGSKCRV